MGRNHTQGVSVCQYTPYRIYHQAGFQTYSMDSGWDRSFLYSNQRILPSEFSLTAFFIVRVTEKTIVALARKILKLVWHLLTNDELYQETETLLTKSTGLPNPHEAKSFSVSAAIELLVKAGFQIINGDEHHTKGDLGTWSSQIFMTKNKFHLYKAF